MTAPTLMAIDAHTGQTRWGPGCQRGKAQAQAQEQDTQTSTHRPPYHPHTPSTPPTPGWIACRVASGELIAEPAQVTLGSSFFFLAPFPFQDARRQTPTPSLLRAGFLFRRRNQLSASRPRFNGAHTQTHSTLSTKPARTNPTRAAPRGRFFGTHSVLLRRHELATQPPGSSGHTECEIERRVGIARNSTAMVC